MVTNVVNKVNGNDYYNYTKLKMPDAADKTDNGEQFSLAYQRAQEETEEKDKNDRSEESGAVGASGQRTVMQGGVKLELSGSGRTYAEKEQSNTTRIEDVGQGLVGTIRSWVTALVQSVREILYKIWNDPTPSGEPVEVDEVEESAEPERLSEEYLALKNPEDLQNPEFVARQQVERETKRDEEIQRLLRSGDMDQVISLVTENGQKTMAKNSTLLTYYDRSGKITPLSASDQERILHGDRNARKL